jgi:peptidoglycan-N-acetylglucosamine deacetylase
MTGTEPLDRTSNLVAAVAFGLIATLLPFPAAAVAPSPPPPAAAAPLVAAPTRTVLSDMPIRAGEAPAVALTFDDGPDPRWTPEILDVLRRHGAIATFCMIGTNAEAHPDLVHDVVAAGMRLCDHSRTHDEQLPSASTARMTAEIVGSHDDLAALASAPVHYFRAPGGNWSPTLLDMAAGHEMQPLGWSVDPRDWKRPGAAAVLDAARRQVHPGAVVLLHDGGGNRAETVAALEELLPWLTAQGYRFTFPT